MPGETKIMNSRKPIIIDLFCGCGGFSLGAARAGFFVAGAADNDSHAISAHKTNFPRTKHINVDLSQTTGVQIRELLSLDNAEIDGIIGGPPCQGFSSIGRRDGRDSRNLLFGHFFRLIDELRPRFFLSENVPGILRPSYDSIRKAAFNQVKTKYKLLQPMKLAANDYGTPTSRLRVFFFGFRQNEMLSIHEQAFLSPPEIETVTVKDALKGLPRKIRADWQTIEKSWRKTGVSHNGAFGQRLGGLIPKGIGNPEAIRRLQEEKRVSGCIGTRHTQAVIHRFKKIEPGAKDSISKFPRLNPNGFCPTLRAGTGSDRGSYQAARPIHPSEDRVITPREAARLQGFPDWFQFDSTKWHSFRQIGNSVSPILAEHILSSIRKALKRTNKVSKGQ